MRIGLVADTHDRVPVIDTIVREMMARGIGLVLHAGDYIAPFSLKPFLDHRVALAGVFGRNDGDPEGLKAYASAGFGIELFESPHSMELAGNHVLLVHDLGELSTHSIESHGIVIHGFTHKEEMKTRGDTLIVNPGEACGWLYGTASAAVLDMDTKRVEFFNIPGLG